MSRDFHSIGAVAALAVGVSLVGEPCSRRPTLKPWKPVEHFIPPEKISKRKARRLRGKAKSA